MNRRMCRLVGRRGDLVPSPSRRAAAINVNALPQPGKTYSGGYDIVIEFENVLKLPDRAKVVLDGTEVGVVTKVASHAAPVDVTAHIRPRDVSAIEHPCGVQQATVLGDIYVALDRPHDQPAAPALAPAAGFR